MSEKSRLIDFNDISTNQGGIYLYFGNRVHNCISGVVVLKEPFFHMVKFYLGYSSYLV